MRHDARGARRRSSTSATSPTRSRPTRRSTILRALAPDARASARPSCCATAIPAYTTSVGWLGYADDKLRRLCREALAEGWTRLQDEGRRGPRGRPPARPRSSARRSARTRMLMMDANQRWDVDEAIALDARSSRAFDPCWIEEPTSPDDILGHAAIARAVRPIGVATGEHVHNRVMFKQLLQAEADRLLPDRRLPAGRRQRGARRAADGGQVRRAGLPARRRRRPVRARAAPLDRSTTSASAARSRAG